MKKKYIEPELLIIKISPINNIVAESSHTVLDDTEGNYDDDGDARENNIFDNNHSIWDNAW